MGRQDVDAAKGQRLRLWGRPHQFLLAIKPSSTAAELAMLVEEQMPRGRAVLHRQGGEGVMFRVKPDHAPKIDGADDIDVMQNEGLLQPPAGLKKERRGFLQAAAGVEQDFLARNLNPHPEVIVGFQILDNHLRVMMRDRKSTRLNSS